MSFKTVLLIVGQPATLIELPMGKEDEGLAVPVGKLVP